MGRWHQLSRGEGGSAIVEFHFLGVLLLVPFVYILVATLDVQRTAYGVTQAAREAGRVYAVTGDEAAARRAARVALTDQRVDVAAADISITCSLDPCFQPGSEVTVTVDGAVPLPLLPDTLADTVNAEVPVRATHAAVVDRYAELS